MDLSQVTFSSITDTFQSNVISVLQLMDFDSSIWSMDTVDRASGSAVICGMYSSELGLFAIVSLIFYLKALTMAVFHTGI